MALTQADAFLIPLLGAEIGIPMTGVHLFESIGDLDPPLAARVAAQLASYRATGSSVAAQLAEVDGMLTRNGLAVPPRPNTYAEYIEWSNATVHAVASATGPDTAEGAVAALGRTVGELVATLAVRIAIDDLLELAPTNERLVAIDQRLAKRIAESVSRVDGISKFPTLSLAVRPHGERLATFARMLPVLDRDTKGAAHVAGEKMVFEKLGEHTRALRTDVMPFVATA